MYIILLNRPVRVDVTPLNKTKFEGKMYNLQAERKTKKIIPRIV
jgi:hypothetical protein